MLGVFPQRPHNKLVGARGFEPPTPCSQSRCATRLRHAPKHLGNPRVEAPDVIVPDQQPFQRPIRAAIPYPGQAKSSSRIARAFTNALARWLSRFLTSGPISARVSPREGTSKMGSYPKP